MSHTGKDVTWNTLFGSAHDFGKDGKGRTITGDYDRGWYAALDAARDAVAAVPPIDQWVDDNGLVSLVYDKAEALAAIDALRTTNP